MTHQLTGNWYIKKCIFSFQIMVEFWYNVELESIDGKETIKQYQWKKANEYDLLKLDIRIY